MPPLVVRLQYRLPRVFVTNIAFLISSSSLQATLPVYVLDGKKLATSDLPSQAFEELIRQKENSFSNPARVLF